MEKSFELIKLSIKFTGFNVYTPNPSRWHTFCRIIFFTASSAMFFGSIYFSVSNKDASLSDRMYIGIVSLVYFAGIFQASLFWKNKEEQVELVEYLNALHKRSLEDWMKPLFEDTSEKFYKVANYILKGSIFNIALVALIPVFVPGIKYIYPMMEFRFVNDTSMNHHINFAMQTLGYIEMASTFYTFPIIFFIFNVNLLSELKFIAKLCTKVGEKEEKSMNIQSTPEAFGAKDVLSPSLLQTIYDDLDIDNDEVDTEKLLRFIIEYHNNALTFCDMIDNVFSFNILIWEAIFLIVSCLAQVLILFDPARALLFSLILMTGVMQYFFISLINSEVYEGMLKIAVSLYGSKWYLLDVKLRKDFLQILMMGQKDKAFSVGFLGLSNLERFQEELNVVYNICLAINQFVK